VTFREAESARKACEDPTPVIDGRRANCNLASLGRAQHPVHPGRPSSAGSYFGVPVPRAFYLGGYGHHRPFPLGYYQGFPVPQYSYPSYGTEYISPQGTLNPYPAQQYLPIYGVMFLCSMSHAHFIHHVSSLLEQIIRFLYTKEQAELFAFALVHGSSVAVSTAFVLAWQEIILAFIRKGDKFLLA
ncbi:hypothetical protein ACJX0J_021242, partial [Zea mays]